MGQRSQNPKPIIGSLTVFLMSACAAESPGLVLDKGQRIDFFRKEVRITASSGNELEAVPISIVDYEKQIFSVSTLPLKEYDLTKASHALLVREASRAYHCGCWQDFDPENSFEHQLCIDATSRFEFLVNVLRYAKSEKEFQCKLDFLTDTIFTGQGPLGGAAYDSKCTGLRIDFIAHDFPVTPPGRPLPKTCIQELSHE
jgi:hypothetical protein